MSERRAQEGKTAVDPEEARGHRDRRQQARRSQQRPDDAVDAPEGAEARDESPGDRAPGRRHKDTPTDRIPGQRPTGTGGELLGVRSTDTPRDSLAAVTPLTGSGARVGEGSVEGTLASLSIPLPGFF